MKTFIRYRANGAVSYGLLEADTVIELEGDLFEHAPTGVRRKLSEVKVLVPCIPGKVLAVGRNYKSHLDKLPTPTRPEIFYKPVSCLQDPDGPIVCPKDSTNIHYEGELVLVIGKRIRHASRDQALAAIFGGTCGNDVTERDWQRGPDKDVQWWRAKGSDTFGPLGPSIVTGLDWDNLQVRTRLNGEVVQDQGTRDFIFDCATQISFISRYVTLDPGDVVYTGTPGITRKMGPGDTVEVEVEGIGVLRNPVVAE